MKKTIMIILASAALFSSCGDSYRSDASGTFEATDITLSAETSGKIISFDVDEGDSVALGQLLAQIDTMQLYYQRMQLLRQQSASSSSRPEIALQLASLRRELEKQRYERQRIVNLLAEGAATTKQLDDIDAAIGILESRIAAQNSSLSRNTAAIDESASAIAMQVCQVDDRIADCSIFSPIDGTVLTKYCEAGEYAVPGKPLLKLADLRRMYLRAYFTSEQLADIAIGQEVTVVADFGGDRQYEYPGTIVWIADESEFTPKNIQTRDSRANLVYAVKISVVNDGRLKIGGYGDVIL